MFAQLYRSRVSVATPNVRTLRCFRTRKRADGAARNLVVRFAVGRRLPEIDIDPQLVTCSTTVSKIKRGDGKAL